MKNTQAGDEDDFYSTEEFEQLEWKFKNLSLEEALNTSSEVILV